MTMSGKHKARKSMTAVRRKSYLQSWHPPMTLSWQDTAWWNSCLTLRQLLEPQLGSPQALACTSSAIVRAI